MNLCIHYGFGDYVMCYGLVKELAKTEDINLFAIRHCADLHIENIKRLFKSIQNVNIITAKTYFYKNIVYIGYEKFFDALEHGGRLQNQRFFYKQAGVPLKLLWSNFYFERDLKKEKEIYYDRLGLKDNEEFVFLHDDPFRGFEIKREHVIDAKIIRLIDYQDISILDSLYLVEKSTQFHVMNTGLLAFVDQMKIKHKSLNYHRYVRPAWFEQPILKMKWNIIN